MLLSGGRRHPAEEREQGEGGDEDDQDGTGPEGMVTGPARV